MSDQIPVKCPCCDGWGKRSFYDYSGTALNYKEVVCPACGGAGVVWYVVEVRAIEELPHD